MNNLPEWSNSRALFSLTSMCVRVLCRSVAKIREGSLLHLSPLYDENLLEQTKSKEPPGRLLEILYLHNTTQAPLLDINSRQVILDYITRVGIHVTSDFLLHLMLDGGVYHLDLEYFIQLFHDQLGGQVFEMYYGPLFYNLCHNANKSIQSLILPAHYRLCWINVRHVQFPNLKQLQIGASVGFSLESCPNLIKLTLDNFDPIFECWGLPTPICQSLVELNCLFEFNELRPLMYCLVMFPNISRLQLNYNVELIHSLISTANSSSPEQPLAQNALKVLANLRHLEQRNPLPPGRLQLLLDTCPNLESLKLPILIGTKLTNLATASRLRKLELTAEDNIFTPKIDFQSYILPMLKEIGTQLTTLYLDKFCSVNLAECARHCPNLESLTVLNSHLTGKYDLLLAHFTKLKYLQLNMFGAQRESAFRFILMFTPQLEHVTITNAYSISNADLEAIKAVNPLKMLKTFVLKDPGRWNRTILAKLFSASMSWGNLIHHDCGLKGPFEDQDRR